MLFAVTALKAENQPIGTWQFHPAFSAPAQKVIDIGETVYYISGGNMFSYDKKNDESYSYTVDNKLSDIGISDIYYNYDKNYLVIVYTSGNVDIMDSDGNVYNMSDIKDSTYKTDFEVNDVAFDGDYMYMATNFGIVQFDCRRHEVVQSGIYNVPVKGITVMGDNLVAYFNKAVRYIGKDKIFSQSTAFRQLFSTSEPMELHAVSDTQLLKLATSQNDRMFLFIIDFEKENYTDIKRLANIHSSFSKLIHGESGKLYYAADSRLYELSDDYQQTSVVAEFPEDFGNARIGTYKGIPSVWSLNNEGIANHSFDEDGGVTVNIDRFRPEEFSVSGAYYLVPARDKKHLYVQNLGATSYKFGMTTNIERRGRSKIQNAARIELATGDKKDITLYPVDTKLNSVPANNIDKYLTACTSIIPDPDDIDTYFVGSMEEGVFKVKDGKMVGRYDSSNSPYTLVDNRYICYGLGVDRGGNLWVMQSGSSAEGSQPILILPSAKRKLDPKDVKPEDWYVPDLISLGYTGGQDAMFLMCEKSNMIFVVDHNTSWTLLACDTRGTFDKLADDKFYLWRTLVDQDGQELHPGRKCTLMEDKNGHVWFGTNAGVIKLQSPSNATNPGMTVTHVKVPRNDGTNMADYLLNTEEIYAISEDAANRKWFAQKDSGLFLTTADGDEILANLTSDKSPLTSNMFNSVFDDPRSSTIYIGTAKGMYTYSSDATPSMDDYSDIYAYPNPVRPDYSGPIYIRGLMDNSLVKIADVSGTVVYQGRSEGGLFTWNGCNASGSRVKTGVYYVMVSQNSTGSASGAVTKIMVVN